MKRQVGSVLSVLLALVSGAVCSAVFYHSAETGGVEEVDPEKKTGLAKREDNGLEWMENNLKYLQDRLSEKTKKARRDEGTENLADQNANNGICSASSTSFEGVYEIYNRRYSTYILLMTEQCDLDVDIVRLFNIGYPLVDRLLDSLFKIAFDLRDGESMAEVKYAPAEERMEKYTNLLSPILEHLWIKKADFKKSIRLFINSITKKLSEKKNRKSTEYLNLFIKLADKYFYRLFVDESARDRFAKANRLLLNIYYKDIVIDEMDSALYNALDLHIIYTENVNYFLHNGVDRVVYESVYPKLKEKCKFIKEPSKSFLFSESLCKIVEYYHETKDHRDLEESEISICKEPCKALNNPESYTRIVRTMMQPVENDSYESGDVKEQERLKEYYSTAVQGTLEEYYSMVPFFWKIHPLMDYLLTSNVFFGNYIEKEGKKAYVDLFIGTKNISVNVPITLTNLAKLCTRDVVHISISSADISDSVSEIVEYLKKSVDVRLALQHTSDESSCYCYSSSEQDEIYQSIYSKVLDRSYTGAHSIKVEIFEYISLFVQTMSIFFSWMFYNMLQYFVVANAIVRIYITLRRKHSYHIKRLFNLFSMLLCILAIVYSCSLVIVTLHETQLNHLFPVLYHITLSVVTVLLLSCSMLFNLNRYSFGTKGRISFVMKIISYSLALVCALITPVLFILGDINTYTMNICRNMGVFSSVLFYAGASLEKEGCAISRGESVDMHYKIRVISGSAVLMGMFITFYTNNRYIGVHGININTS
ncbi:hypothetical protein NEMIN01_1592 [Nematocida minor]|uniref:uncharacterized protein n=1 Tax=Nematocida minor TaxID=1912983 RepID=UPI00221EF3F3|nr:uncharacterized protein NEMIN01_1592 [Nematocida minor]KAI5191608.1 hypothetical protein NEMIN01_1592 [Nematocida minor]